MEETNISVQIYSFLEVTAVPYNEKPIKDGRRCDFHDEERTVLDISTESTSRRNNRLHDTCSQICQTFSLESQYSEV